MGKLTWTAPAMALGAMLLAAVTAVPAASTASGTGTPRTVWKPRVLKSTSPDVPAHGVRWSPYRTAALDLSTTVPESLSASGPAEEIPLPAPLLDSETLPEVGPPVCDDEGACCGSQASGDSCSSCPTDGCAGGFGYDGRATCEDCWTIGAALAHVVTNLNYFGGVHGFKGPTDLGRNGNFGFNYGMVWGAPLVEPWGIGYQTGVSVVHSNFTGDQVVDVFSSSHRDQVFFTSGLFHRPVCGGIQWGVVYDLMRDNYRDNATTGQIRSELALGRPGFSDFGFFGAFGANNDRMVVPMLNQVITEVNLAPMDVYSLFYRRYFTGGGIGRVWAGATDHGDGVFGADATIPLGTSWALENSFTYLAPKDGGTAGQERESWGVFLRLVWYPGRQAVCELSDPYTPLMAVANNTNMLIDADPRP